MCVIAFRVFEYCFPYSKVPFQSKKVFDYFLKSLFMCSN